VGLRLGFPTDALERDPEVEQGQQVDPGEAKRPSQRRNRTVEIPGAEKAKTEIAVGRRKGRLERDRAPDKTACA